MKWNSIRWNRKEYREDCDIVSMNHCKAHRFSFSSSELLDDRTSNEARWINKKQLVRQEERANIFLSISICTGTFFSQKTKIEKKKKRKYSQRKKRRIGQLLNDSVIEGKLLNANAHVFSTCTDYVNDRYYIIIFSLTSTTSVRSFNRRSN